MLCIAEEAAQRWVARCSEQERGWVPHHEGESWLGRMREVEMLRVPLVFGRVHADVCGPSCGRDEQRGRRVSGRGEHGRDAVGASHDAVYGDG